MKKIEITIQFNSIAECEKFIKKNKLKIKTQDVIRVFRVYEIEKVEHQTREGGGGGKPGKP